MLRSYKHFPAVGAFSVKFSIAPSSETTDRIKKVRGANMVRTSSITMPSMMGIVGRPPTVDEKVWCFLSACHALELQFVITETLWSSVIFKTIMVPLHTGRFVVVHLYSTFSVDPQNFPLGASLYQKLPFLRFWGCKPHFLQPQRWHLAWGCRPGTRSPSQIL